MQNLKENCAAEHAALDDVHPSFGRSDDQVNVDAGNSALKDINSSAGMYLPAPEKLLSVPEGFGGPRDLLVEATPGDLTHVDESDAGSRIISGKKRSYTESTLTEQSLNSVESSRVVRAKRNVEAVPDDDDLLSSILGRIHVFPLTMPWEGLSGKFYYGPCPHSWTLWPMLGHITFLVKPHGP